MNDYKKMIDHIHPDETLVKQTKDQMKQKTIEYSSHKLVYACIILTILVPVALIYISEQTNDFTPDEDGLISERGTDVPIKDKNDLTFQPVYTKQVADSKSSAVTTPSTTDSLLDFYIKSSLHFLQQEQNTIYSPSSTAYALAMLTSGASGTSKEQLESFFGYDQIELEAILHHSYVSQQIEGFMIDHSIWFDDHHTLNTNTLQSIADLYFASCFQTDFANQTAVNEINQYVNVKSNGLIYPEYTASSNQAMKLLNVTTLESRWTTPFESLDPDYENRFVLSNGTKADVTTLRAIIHSARYESNNQYEMSDLYLNNGFYMRVVLPTDDLPLQELASDQDLMQTIVNTRLYPKEDHTIAIELPKFSISNTWDLNPYLKKQGVTNIFNKNSHDFDLMGEDLYVDEVKQLSAIEVTQYGLRASAATSVDMKDSAINISSITQMNVNRPFLYMIFSPNHELVFLGTVYDPSV